ncbi:acyltransferase [Mangrovimicrobium sediminis]|uniref:Acyltransferase n=1 Tax=Mangrovimicrobium sediminis TaxID=2562682 RepID=A0A4Z0LZH5_9GAMM|nr:acyltransferase [Haliea sp. SAOS-164]TGD72671.1 acyltransferase [Haliea sp. SAOS-164]
MASESQASTVSGPTGGHWSNARESGSLAGLRLLWGVHRLLGRRALSLLLKPVVVYFIAVRTQARRGAWQYLQAHYQRFPERWQRAPGRLDLYRQFREFAESVVDKLLAWHLEIDADEFHQVNPAATEKLLNDPRGQLIIGSHLGNIEYCRGYMHRYESKVVNILVYERHAGNYVEMMRRMNPESRINVYQVDEFDITTILLLKEKIEAGQWVFIAGDRIPLSGTERTVEVEFLGRPTRLPIGPYLLAKALQCPVWLMFSYKNYGGSDHRLYFEVVEYSEQVKLPRKQRDAALQSLAQGYANHLERICRDAPYQWFNFYDYWPAPEAGSTAREAVNHE